MGKFIVMSAMALLCCIVMVQGQARHNFALGKSDFLLDGKPYQIISGELHPARIPREYWKQRIQMAKAMGCNTIAVYVFWNYQEPAPGEFDFTTENRDIAAFIKLVQAEGMWVMLRPGPYVCGEWDFGGLPPYLLRIPDIKIRSMDPRYMAAVERYIKALAVEVKDLQISNGGPIIIVQIENEYGSFANDKAYLKKLKQLWEENSIHGPFYTADGPVVAMMEAGSLPGVAIGLDGAMSESDYERATTYNPEVPNFSSETYPGWLTHWGEKWACLDKEGILKEVKFLMDTKRSFNLYVIHGGTNFGFTAGANLIDNKYQPDLTSYDYGAPIDEQGNATENYMALRELIGSYNKKKLPPVPAPIPVIAIPAIQLTPFTSIWEHLPAAVPSLLPETFEAYGQDYGFMVYKTILTAHKSGKLELRSVHDYATVFLNGIYVGKIDRRLGEHTIQLPETTVKDPVLEILVEAMGRVNYGPDIMDRKGITDKVSLNNMTLMNWEVYPLPMKSDFVQQLSAGTPGNRPGQFFKGNFSLAFTGDTYLDLSGFKKGFVWVNGHNLGRFWEVGPQTRLYCPASWLNKGMNEITVFDLHQLNPAMISGEFKLIPGVKKSDPGGPLLLAAILLIVLLIVLRFSL